MGQEICLTLTSLMSFRRFIRVILQMGSQRVKALLFLMEDWVDMKDSGGKEGMMD